MLRRSLGIVLLAAVLAAPTLASASVFDSIKDGASSLAGSYGGSGALLQQLSSGSLNLGSMQNVAGVLGYCHKQGYAPSAADTVKDKLLGKLGGEDKAEQDTDYKQGLSGVLKGSDGKSFDLSNIKDSIGKKICGLIADRAASSFLGK